MKEKSERWKLELEKVLVNFSKYTLSLSCLEYTENKLVLLDAINTRMKLMLRGTARLAERNNPLGLKLYSVQGVEDLAMCRQESGQEV